MRDIKTELDGGELTDIQLVERILRLKAEKGQAASALKSSEQDLAERLQGRGVTEEMIGDRLIIVNHKLLTQFNQGTLKSLDQCCTADQVSQVVRSVPSGKQLRALSEMAGASAKAVIESARSRVETDTLIVRIRKPRKARKGRRRGR
jgi:hypothetical protein